VLAKDEVNSTLNVALAVDLSTGLSEKSVLVTVHANTVVALLRSVGANCESLGTLAVGVLEVDVVDLGSSSPVTESGGFIIVGSAGQETGRVGEDDFVVLVGRSVGGVTVDRQNSLAGWDVDLLAVGTGLDENALGSGGGGAKSIHSRLKLINVLIMMKTVRVRKSDTDAGVLARGGRLGNDKSARRSRGTAGCQSSRNERAEGEKETHDKELCKECIGQKVKNEE
jgi:hypothetical protein